MSTPTLKSEDGTLRDRRQDDRRLTLRITVPEGVPLFAKIESPVGVLRSVQCINLSSHGALLDFGDGKCPRFQKGHKVSLNLKLADEITSIPGLVTHRTESRLGISFDLNTWDPNSLQGEALANILGILERAIDRRSSPLLKSRVDPPTEGGSSTPPSKPLQIPPTLFEAGPTRHDRRQQDRRNEPRIPILQGIPLQAEVVTSDRILREVRCVDLSPRGALLDFGMGKCPPMELNSQVLVNLRIGSDTANIPSYVRHRTNNRIGVEFPFDRQASLKEQKESLSLILRTLERAVARRRSR